VSVGMNSRECERKCCLLNEENIVLLGGQGRYLYFFFLLMLRIVSFLLYNHRRDLLFVMAGPILTRTVLFWIWLFRDSHCGARGLSVLPARFYSNIDYSSIIFRRRSCIYRLVTGHPITGRSPKLYSLST
jgi:hypothetical protein